ncbi:hypothetical protein DFJ58DRAFT_811218 [Suillus subalutaceus]|uniref:uncharacterized protein n=1 Tax=Suillus subalutaceus TaxID=48586 RepID=UPI001B872FF0|nr:uncharacterized protein DFJ58DRAFT_811218 [Suillus subalutaceus]KAG1840091.1 hypothetical protein DFJ58DRAFT_811218 [Suillus subalutaceus]
MDLNSSPRKQIPLARGDETPRKPSAPSLTRRVFYCGVVVEGCDSGRRLPEDVQDLVLSLGDPWLSQNDSHILPSATDTSFSEHHQPDGLQRKRALTDSTALTDVVNELVNTERSYVKRLRILKNDYADPLRQFSRNKNTAILPSYEAKTLFGNIDNFLPVNEAFLVDLEKMVAPDGPETVGGVGDVALRHFKDLRGFEHYRQYYVKREEAQSIFEREMMKKSSGFAAYVDRIKYSNADTRNRVGLRELLMDPVQRIPRYTLLFRTMIKYMASGDPQRAKLIEADDIASKIALAETDEQTKRAAIMHCLNATVDGFPPGLISISRRFIDCIDVDDIVQDGPASASTSVSSLALNVLHCTLFLFDDKLMIVKRPGNGEKSGRLLAGLDDVDKLAKTGGLPLRMKKSGLSCKGVIDLPDIVAADVGGADFHIYIENPPQDQSDRWSGRSFRCLSVVFPPAPANLDPTRTTNEKDRFLENLWNAQAKYRTKSGQSVVLCADEREVESRGGRVTMARTYFNVYQRTAFLQEPKKTKIVMHIDTLGTADPIPFGINGPPYVVVRIQPMAGEISRYTVTSSDPSDESEEDIVQTARIPGRIVQTIHQYGLFKFKTSNDSRPATPTASSRSRAHIFSLDAISRNLFNAIPGSSKGDFFGGSISSHRRSKSSTSRSSVYTQTTTTTGDGSLTKFSRRSNSTATAPTSLADDDSLYASKSSSSRKKLVKRSRSPGTSRSSPLSRQTSPSRNSSRTSFYSDGEEELPVRQDPSDQDLSLRLELARRNSQNQHGKQAAKSSSDRPPGETIYEDDPPRPLRPTSRASTAASQRSTTPRPTSTSPGRGTRRPHSRFGPRSISPLPPKSPTSTPPDLPSMDDELALEARIALDAHIDSFQDDSSFIEDDAPSPLPRSRRQPFVVTGNMDSTPRQPNSTTGSVEPLSIKKKPSTRSSTYTPSRKSYTRISPLSKSTARIVSPRKVSPQIRIARVGHASHSPQVDHADELLRISLSTKDDIESSHRVIKRMKLDLQEIRANDEMASLDESRRCSSPEKSLARTPQRTIPQPITKEAQQRLDEMRQLISKRQQEGTPRNRPRSFVTELSTPGPPAILGTSNISLLSEPVADADKLLASALSSHETLHQSLTQVVSDFKEKLSDLEKARVELQNTKRQCELVKSLLADATAEKEIMYEAFNEELDAMYNDAHLPDDEAWTNMTADLRESKESQNALRKENSQLKRKLAEVESEKEEWGALLRAHGLIP